MIITVTAHEECSYLGNKLVALMQPIQGSIEFIIDRGHNTSFTKYDACIGIQDARYFIQHNTLLPSHIARWNKINKFGVSRIDHYKDVPLLLNMQLSLF